MQLPICQYGKQKMGVGEAQKSRRPEMTEQLGKRLHANDDEVT